MQEDVMNHYRPETGMSLSGEAHDRQYVSSGSDIREMGSSSEPKKRASRAGTRSVNTLTSAQLERKRQNDRDAQRAIRKRTKDHITTLEEENALLKERIESLERINSSLDMRTRELDARCQHMARENDFYRMRAGTDGFMAGDQQAEQQPPDSAVSAADAQASSDVRFMPQDMSRSSSTAARQSISLMPNSYQKRPDGWRRQSHTPVFESPTSVRPPIIRTSSWEARNRGASGQTSQASSDHGMSQQQHRSYSESTTQDSRPDFQYMSDIRQQGPFVEANKGHFPEGMQPPGQYSMPMNMQQAGQAFQQGMAGPMEYNNMGMPQHAHRPSVSEQGQGHASYEMPIQHMETGPESYAESTGQRHDSMQRVSIPNSYTQTASGDFSQQGIGYTPNADPAAYGYPQYRSHG